MVSLLEFDLECLLVHPRESWLEFCLVCRKVLRLEEMKVFEMEFSKVKQIVKNLAHLIVFLTACCYVALLMDSSMGSQMGLKMDLKLGCSKVWCSGD